jgi:hypothetical protein
MNVDKLVLDGNAANLSSNLFSTSVRPFALQDLQSIRSTASMFCIAVL